MDRIGERTHSAGKFSEASARVTALDTIHGCAQRAWILNRLSEDMNLRTERRDLGAIRRAARAQYGEGFSFRIGQTRTGTHAEGIVDHQKFELVAAGTRCGSIDKRASEGKYDQQKQREAQRQEEQV